MALDKFVDFNKVVPPVPIESYFPKPTGPERAFESDDEKLQVLIWPDDEGYTALFVFDGLVRHEARFYIARWRYLLGQSSLEYSYSVGEYRISIQWSGFSVDTRLESHRKLQKQPVVNCGISLDRL